MNNFLRNLNANKPNIYDSNIKITPLVICTPQQTPAVNNYIYNKSHKFNTRTSDLNRKITNNNESIIYIDSIDELENYSISSSISSLSSISSPDKSSQSDSYSIDMNQLLARLKYTTKNLNNIQQQQQQNKHLTPSNSVESFEFISEITKPVENNNACYEKSWDKTSVLLDKLSNNTTENVLTNSSIFLASSLIEIANQQQHQRTHTDDTILRNRKSNIPAVRRISFPIPKVSSFRDFEKLTPISSNTNIKTSNSSVTSTSIPVIKSSRIIFNTTNPLKNIK